MRSWSGISSIYASRSTKAAAQGYICDRDSCAAVEIGGGCLGCCQLGIICVIRMRAIVIVRRCAIFDRSQCVGGKLK